MGIYVWGTGCGASELIAQGLTAAQIDLFVDSYPRTGQFLGKPVVRPETADWSRCALLIVTTRHTQDVARRCQELGVDAQRILYLKDSVCLADRNQTCTAAKEVLGQELLDRLLPRHRIIPAPPFQSALAEADLAGDYVRLATLELLCRRLDTVPGAAAELGVYRGFFAGCINRLLPQRRLYLFDSFAGFSPEEGAAPAFQEAHHGITPQALRQSLPHPEQAVIIPGFFPKSLNGLEDRFCLVSPDVDFQEATLAGLTYFWPRLNPGGYLLLHDWGNPRLPGVAQALEAYEQRLHQRLCALPLCDYAGTLVLCKPPIFE